MFWTDWGKLVVEIGETRETDCGVTSYCWSLPHPRVLILILWEKNVHLSVEICVWVSKDRLGFDFYIFNIKLHILYSGYICLIFGFFSCTETYLIRFYLILLKVTSADMKVLCRFVLHILIKKRSTPTVTVGETKTLYSGNIFPLSLSPPLVPLSQCIVGGCRPCRGDLLPCCTVLCW